jgi:hypothetical protein
MLRIYKKGSFIIFGIKKRPVGLCTRLILNKPIFSIFNKWNNIEETEYTNTELNFNDRMRPVAELENWCKIK